MLMKTGHSRAGGSALWTKFCVFDAKVSGYRNPDVRTAAM